MNSVLTVGKTVTHRKDFTYAIPKQKIDDDVCM
jgi:hypothetical protein